MVPSPVVDAIRATGAEVRLDAPLARRVWWRVGGPADALVTVHTRDQLATTMRLAHAAGVPVVPLGNGSNVLVHDAGIRGVVLELDGELADVAPIPATADLWAGAGMKLTVLLARAKRNGWTGLECFAGIPGTVGGAVRMNAGSNLGETHDPLVSVEIVSVDGVVGVRTREELRMSYRTTHLPRGAVVARARLHTTGGDPVESEARVREFLDRRKATQPLDLPSCGSTFRNPPGDAAGRLIESAGLKGFTIGGAQVSPKHANFVVNLGDATAEDIRRVIAHVVETVARVHGVHLEREVEYLGGD